MYRGKRMMMYSCEKQDVRRATSTSWDIPVWPLRAIMCRGSICAKVVDGLQTSLRVGERILEFTSIIIP